VLQLFRSGTLEKTNLCFALFTDIRFFVSLQITSIKAVNFRVPRQTKQFGKVKEKPANKCLLEWLAYLTAMGASIYVHGIHSLDLDCSKTDVVLPEDPGLSVDSRDLHQKLSIDSKF